MANTIIATKVRDLTGYQGDARLYRLSSPVEYTRYEENRETGAFEELALTTEWVVVSAANVMFSGPEVLIFPADEEGVVTSWGEIGGYRGGLSHTVAIEDTGWEIA